MAVNAQRIAAMESCLLECTDATAALSAQLERMEQLREPMIALFRYYGSRDWYQDREDWEQIDPAERPAGVTAGVLSEDAVYDAITALRDAAFHMLEQATDILKNRI